VSAAAPKPRDAVYAAAAMGVGYVAIYLCRKNLSVAVPMLQESFGASKAEVGIVATAGTLAYMLGKFASGGLYDRIGGRAGFLSSMAGVGLFGALSAFAPGIWPLALIYGANRFWGAGAWNAMVKLTSSWFPPLRLATAVAGLSLSFVLGGILATLFAKLIVDLGGDWRAVMAVPALPLVLVLLFCARTVRPGPLIEAPADEAPAPAVERPSLPAALGALLRRPAYQTLCILSFTLTLLREAFATWGVDFLKSTHAGEGSLSVAALQSTSFDLAGAVAVILTGIVYDRLGPDGRRRLVAGLLFLLTGVLALLATAGKASSDAGVTLLAAAGLLIYGPYSLLGGVGSIENGGTERAATAAGFVDGIGYLAALLAGYTFGQVVDAGGYPTAFAMMAGLTLVSSAAALRLRSRPPVVVET
jgi:sugar phosphate permease